MKNQNRIEEVDLLRGLAAILMILGHSFIVYPIDISGVPWCKALQHFIYTFHMELFFLLAGVVYQCQNYSVYIVKKVKRILVPYVVFGMFTILCRVFGGVFVNGTESIGEGIIKLLFYGGDYWFLYVSFILFAIYPFIEKNMDKMWKKLVFAAVLLVMHETVELPHVFMINNLFFYTPYFVIGKCIKKDIQGGGYFREHFTLCVLYDRFNRYNWHI